MAVRLYCSTSTVLPWQTGTQWIVVEGKTIIAHAFVKDGKEQPEPCFLPYRLGQSTAVLHWDEWTAVSDQRFASALIELAKEVT